MFQIEDLLQTAIAALVASDPVAVVPELDRGGGDPRLDNRAGLQRHGVGVRPHLRASRLIDAREADLGQVEGFGGQGQQMLLLSQQPRSDTLGLARHDPTLIGAAVLKQFPVQRRKIGRHRHRNPVVAAEVAHLALHAALLMAFARGAELRLIPPVRTEGDSSCRQLSLRAAQDLLHRARKVIVAKLPEDTLEVRERQFVRL